MRIRARVSRVETRTARIKSHLHQRARRLRRAKCSRAYPRKFSATRSRGRSTRRRSDTRSPRRWARRSEEHTSELQSRSDLVCRLLLEKKKKKKCKKELNNYDQI